MSLAGDQFVKDYVGKTTQLKVKAVKAATMKVVYKDQTTQEVVGEETLTGSRQDADGDGIFNVSELPVPEGYKAETVGDFFTKDYADTALQDVL